MIGVDTNILVRFLTGDDAKQSSRVYAFFKNVEEEKKELFISSLVVLELVWVLESVYEIERIEILESIHSLIQMPIFHIENLTTIQNFILDAQHSKYDLSDLLIAQTAKTNGCEKVFTFDKNVSKHKLFQLLS